MSGMVRGMAGALLVLALLLGGVSCSQFTPLPDEGTGFLQFSPEGGVFDDEVEVALSTSVPGAAIRYTTDGTDPDSSSERYTGPIHIPADELEVVIRAAVEGKFSLVIEKHYTVKPKHRVATPRLSPRTGVFAHPVNVTITCATAGAEIRYTTDGSRPGPNSMLYREPVAVPSGARMVIRAIAVKAGLHDSSQTAGLFLVKAHKAADRGILFASRRDEVPVDMEGMPPTRLVSELYVMKSSGEEQRRLTTFSRSDEDNFPMDFWNGGADWSPDGKRIVYKYRTDLNSEEDTLYVMNRDGTGRDWIAVSQEIYNPKWSPDGKQIAWYSFGGERGYETGICLVRPDGSGRECILTDSEFPEDTFTVDHPSWSPDSRRIVFSVFKLVPGTTDYQGRLWIMNADGTGLTEIPGQTTSNSHPDWHPGSDRILYSATVTNQTDIYVMNTDGSGVEQLTFHPASDGEPDWSPDGSKIVFTTNRDGNREIYAMDADGTDQVNLTRNQAEDFNPAW